jgi:predicted Zn-dependent peptidase
LDVCNAGGKPTAIARYALNVETEELTPDFYENYIKTINAVTAEDVLNAANKYFLIDNTRLVREKGQMLFRS